MSGESTQHRAHPMRSDIAAPLWHCQRGPAPQSLKEVGRRTRGAKWPFANATERSHLMALRRRAGASPREILERPFTGFAVPDPVETFLKMPGGAAFPCALVAPGLFRAPKSEAISNQTAGSTALPTGTGPFMLAEFYAREAAVMSRDSGLDDHIDFDVAALSRRFGVIQETLSVRSESLES